MTPEMVTDRTQFNDPATAFPFHLDKRAGEVVDWPGMSLRDYFAAKAMQALWSNESNRERACEDARQSGLMLYAEIATQAYEMADAMLKAREGGQ